MSTINDVDLSNDLSSLYLLNQARAGLWPARAWFLKIVPVRTSVCVCVRPRRY